MVGVGLMVAVWLGPAAPSIDWRAPATCPDAAQMTERVALRLSGVDVAPMAIRGRVVAPSEPGGRWHLKLAMGDEGERHLEADSCGALADAAAVMIAIALDAAPDTPASSIPEPPAVVEPDATETDGQLDPARPADGDPRPAADDRASPIETPATMDAPEVGVSGARDTHNTRWASPRAVLGVMGGVHGVGLPVVAAGIGGRLGVRWGPMRIAATGAHWIRRARSVVDDVAANYQLSTGGLEACGVLGLGRGRAAFELLGCGAFEAGRLRAAGVGASPSRVRRHPWVAVGGGLGAAWIPVAWIALGLRSDVLAPLLARSFVIGDVSAGRIGPVDVRGALTVELRLPNRGGSR